MPYFERISSCDLLLSVSAQNFDTFTKKPNYFLIVLFMILGVGCDEDMGVEKEFEEYFLGSLYELGFMGVIEVYVF